MSQHELAEYMVMVDESNGTSFSVDVANAMSESIDSGWMELEKTSIEKQHVIDAFESLTSVMRRVWGDSTVTDNVACPLSL